MEDTEYAGVGTDDAVTVKVQPTQQGSCKDKEAATHEEIPAITLRTSFATTSKPTNIFRAYILQILKSSVIGRKPFVYRFKDIRYSYVRITGTIISRKWHQTGSVTYIVADETGCIQCIAFPNDELEQAAADVDQCVECGGHGAAEEDALLKKASGVLLQKCVNRLDQFARASALHLGDTAVVLGQVKEKDGRVIVVWDIRRVRSLRQDPDKKKRMCLNCT